jgi:hypothetical protein
MGLEPSDALKLTHYSGLQTLALLAGIDALGYQGERPPDRNTRTVGRANHPARATTTRASVEAQVVERSAV